MCHPSRSTRVTVSETAPGPLETVTITDPGGPGPESEPPATAAADHTIVTVPFDIFPVELTPSSSLELLLPRGVVPECTTTYRQCATTPQPTYACHVVPRVHSDLSVELRWPPLSPVWCRRALWPHTSELQLSMANVPVASPGVLATRTVRKATRRRKAPPASAAAAAATQLHPEQQGRHLTGRNLQLHV